jgi:hypothetical protein
MIVDFGPDNVDLCSTLVDNVLYLLLILQAEAIAARTGAFVQCPSKEAQLPRKK